MQTHVFRRFFVEKAPPGSQKVLKKCPGGIPGATRQLSGGLFWSRMADLKRVLLATPPKHIPPWRPRTAPRCPKALRDAILDQKLKKTQCDFGAKNVEIDAKIEPASAIKVEGGGANTTHKTERESAASRGAKTAQDKDETKRTCDTHLTRYEM